MKQIQPGEWIQPKRRGYRWICCNCNSAHIVNFRLAKLGCARIIQFQLFLPGDVMKSPGTTIAYKSSDGWRWHSAASNGQLVAESGEGYVSRSHAERMAKKYGPSGFNLVTNKPRKKAK